MINIVGVRFKKAGKIYYFDPKDLELELDEAVIVETTRGVELGIVSLTKKLVPQEDVRGELKPILRKATPEDLERSRRNEAREKEAMIVCKAKIEAHGLDMKLVDVEFTFDMNKVIFYFTADGRVDFRDLVKDLASVFRTRIELRQIGVRDEAKMKSGIGPCGRTLCCSSFLADFTSVSIKMAKEQNLSLNPTKISGICGRLMCCLKYEQDTYEEIRKRLPRQGSIVNTPMGRGEVLMNKTIKEQVKVKIFGEGEDVIEFFPISECEMIKGSYEDNSTGKKEPKPDAEETAASRKKDPKAGEPSPEPQAE
ncbi:stage 0 sporulation family protein [Proteiniclasticum sp. QWL-01]|uniref:PSP1 domain-containing protein n=1 Tax=Proteiniclasticum sp. QWL-01 TaxID=3036945 RepID=UPI00220EBE77|nr:stage 0 sporulation family protein [Proteiniclasticum sp. QWL-01]UUM11727.1 stage 0 sporulation family protein [Clostridiaceae bacterium HFYG-1003]WFF73210.1 stage 0 sporulation family protein [Proteiniclasticum sp. QWL-01]